jgi:hypothetical protein
MSQTPHGSPMIGRLSIDLVHSGAQVLRTVTRRLPCRASNHVGVCYAQQGVNTQSDWTPVVPANSS